MTHFRIDIRLAISDTWIDRGENAENIQERLIEWLEEELNPFCVEGEYVAAVHVRKLTKRQNVTLSYK